MSIPKFPFPCRTLACAAIVLASAPAAAAEASALSPGWLVDVQLGPAVAPAYPGARRERLLPAVGFDLRRVGEARRFSAPDDSFGAPILQTGAFRAGPVGNLVAPRLRGYGELAGLKAVRLGVELGAFAEYFIGDRLRLRAEARQGVHGHKGFVVTLGADVIQPVGAFALSVGPRLNFGSARYAQSYFGISPQEAALNGRLTPFAAHGGLVSAGLMSTARYDSGSWNATVYGGAQRLTGAAAASPIPRLVGARNQYTAGLLLGHTFDLSKL